MPVSVFTVNKELSSKKKAKAAVCVVRVVDGDAHGDARVWYAGRRNRLKGVKLQ